MSFDAEGKIATIQQSWDQGALLKQLDVIGKTGRNWPIRDSQDQIKLITKTRGQGADPSSSQAVQRSRENSTNAMRDPHATLFNPRNQEPDRVVSPFSGTRPRQRTFEEILGDDPNTDALEQQSPSRAVAPKTGAGKNFQPSRLFDKPDDVPPEPESPDDAKSPERFRKPHPAKYSHFDFADGSDPADAPQAGVAFDAIKSKHRQTWDFQDFVTPQKPKPGKSLRQQARHWGTDQDDIDESPAKIITHHNKPRRDAGSQIELQDDGEDDHPSQRGAGARPRGAMHNEGLGLYKNHLVTDDGSEPIESPDPRALGNITNLKNRSKSFDPHFEMADESPQKENNKTAAKNGSSDQRENGPNHRIKLGGDGMGNPKGGRGWSLGDDSDEEQQAAPVPGRKGASRSGNAQQAANNFWDY